MLKSSASWRNWALIGLLANNLMVADGFYHIANPTDDAIDFADCIRLSGFHFEIVGAGFYC